MNEAAQNDLDQMDWRRLLTAEERTALLGDIASVSLAAGARLFPDQPWSSLAIAAGSAAAYKSPIEQLGFIEYVVPVLAQALTRIAHSPLTTAAAQTRPALPHRARQVTASAWMAYVRRGRASATLDETATVLSPDTPENRAVKSFVRVLERDCRTIAQIAAAEGEIEAADRAIRCARTLHQMQSVSWLDEVNSLSGDWTHPPTHRDLLRPEYACLARERSRYRKSFCFDWNQPLLTLTPRETWRLYEAWCFLIVLQTLRGQGWDLTPSQEVFAVRAGRLTATLATGMLSRVTLRSVSGRLLTLTYNQAFAEGRESLSHTMQPDITISEGERVWILDAKFKPYSDSGEEGGDINQMHSYRDAIIDSAGSRTVAAAWCLYAGLTQMPNRSHITYGRSKDTPVGAICLRPGNAETVRNLAELLEGWLDSGPSRPGRLPSPET